MSLLPGPTPGTKMEGSILGSQTQSTIVSTKCVASGTRSVHHVADSYITTERAASQLPRRASTSDIPCPTYCRGSWPKWTRRYNRTRNRSRPMFSGTIASNTTFRTGWWSLKQRCPLCVDQSAPPVARRTRDSSNSRRGWAALKAHPQGYSPPLASTPRWEWSGAPVRAIKAPAPSCGLSHFTIPGKFFASTSNTMGIPWNPRSFLSSNPGVAAPTCRWNYCFRTFVIHVRIQLVPHVSSYKSSSTTLTLQFFWYWSRLELDWACTRQQLI